MLFHELVTKGYERPDIRGVVRAEFINERAQTVCPISAAYFAAHQDCTLPTTASDVMLKAEAVCEWFKNSTGMMPHDFFSEFDAVFWPDTVKVEEAIEFARTFYPDLEVEL